MTVCICTYTALQLGNDLSSLAMRPRWLLRVMCKAFDAEELIAVIRDFDDAIRKQNESVAGDHRLQRSPS